MVAAVLLLGTLIAAAPVGALEVRVTIERLEAGPASATGLEAVVDGGALQLRAARVVLPGGWTLDSVRLDCAALPAGTGTLCEGAPWSLGLAPQGGAWRQALGGTLGSVVHSGPGLEVTSTLAAGALAAALRVTAADDTLTAGLSWSSQPLTGLAKLSPPLAGFDWLLAGETSGTIDLRQSPGTAPRANLSLSIAHADFDSPDGRFAAAGLGASLRGSVVFEPATEVSLKGEIAAGELLIDRFYTALDEGAIAVEAQAVADGSSVQVRSVRVADGRALEFAATADFDLDAPLDSIAYRIEHLELHFPLAYERYFETLLAPLSLDKLTVTGSILWRGSGRARSFPEGELDVLDLSVVDRDRGRFAVTGLETQLHAGASPTDSRVAWRGLLLRRINLGAGAARIRTRPGEFELAEPLPLEVLGGRVSFDHIAVVLPAPDAAPDAEPEITLQASLEGLEMAQLTEALGWPHFEGRISGVIPGVSLDAGVLAVDGSIEVDVFDGHLVLSGLSIERPFGVLPSLAANLEVDDIDLQLLTQAFSFGRISGRMDGYMRDLRMLDWKPVAFDAWFGTPADQDRSNAISRQAVNHLTSIGGGGPTAALTGPLLRLFNNFSYRRLGMGCHLHNNICDLRGLEDDANSVLILEGSGVPKIMIRAYNRRMDFPQLVANLAAASSGEGIRIGDDEEGGD